MQLYEYRCTRCGHQFEVFHQVGGPPGTCPACGGPGRRIFSSVGLIFKGSGFHTTDYKKATSSDGESTKGKEATTSGPRTESSPSSTPSKPPSKSSS